MLIFKFLSDLVQGLCYLISIVSTVIRNLISFHGRTTDFCYLCLPLLFYNKHNNAIHIYTTEVPVLNPKHSQKKLLDVNIHDQTKNRSVYVLSTRAD